jgi:type II secretory pathway pseudopilin PulG
MLAAIVVLAFVLPYGAVRTLHARRVRAADEGTRAIADRLHQVIGGTGSGMLTGAEVLAGPGDRPKAEDERWNGAASISLARVLGGGAPAIEPDPWGNAYLSNAAALTTGDIVWVLSAGPDGIVQTPFLAPNGPVGDDRASPATAARTHR